MTTHRFLSSVCQPDIIDLDYGPLNFRPFTVNMTRGLLNLRETGESPSGDACLMANRKTRP
jgi:hypothetical protein